MNNINNNNNNNNNKNNNNNINNNDNKYYFYYHYYYYYHEIHDGGFLKMAKSSVLDWFKPNDLMHNPSKFQSMTLGATLDLQLMNAD